MTANCMKKYERRARFRRFGRRILLLVLLLALLLFLAERNFRPLVLTLAEARSAAMASQVLTGAISEALGDGVAYDDLMDVRMDSGGQVSLLAANTVKMNLLADRAVEAAMRRMQQMTSEELRVPLGAALGLTLLGGTGPSVPVSIVPIGSVQTGFETEFEACGINQTRHKVYMQLRANIRIVIPTGTQTASVTANMLIAESIIVGRVPESFVGYDLGADELNMVP